MVVAPLASRRAARSLTAASNHRHEAHPDAVGPQLSAELLPVEVERVMSGMINEPFDEHHPSATTQLQPLAGDLQ
jgi:hypothetical protein